MIRTVGELLDALLHEERQKLDGSPIKHGPTIGSMYEDLTREALTKSIPLEADLHVTEGFIRANGRLSGQQDCILSIGPGECVPRTRARIHEIDNVVAVVEVKKKLYANEILEGVESLAGLLELEYEPSWSYHGVFSEAWKRIVRRPLPKDRGSIPAELNAIMELLLWDHCFPLRIVFGYHGFRSETRLRRAMLGLIAQQCQRNNRAFSAPFLPCLILNQQVAIAKVTGSPWYTPMHRSGSIIELLASTGRRSTGTVLLDKIWSRLAARGLAHPHFFSPDRYFESWNPLLSANFIPNRGWAVGLHDERMEPASSAYDAPLNPLPADEHDLVVISWIAAQGELDLGMFDHLPDGHSDSRMNMERRLRRLESLGMVGQSWEDPNIWRPLLSEYGMRLGGGQGIAIGDNSSGQFMYSALRSVPPGRVLWVGPESGNHG